MTGAILMYHRINELAVDPHRLCVSPAEFTQHMQHLAHRHAVLSLVDLARAVVDGTLPEGAVAVTFDDGTLDALQSASSVLMDVGIPATFFVNTERVEEEHEPWWDVLGRIFLGNEALPAVLELTLDGAEHVFPTGQVGQPQAVYPAIHQRLMRAALPEREQILAHIVEWSGMSLSTRSTHRLLLPDEIRQLAERPGHTVGSHSVHHLLLPSQSAEEQDREIRESRRELERILGRPVTLFSYPYGAHDADTVRRVRGAGYRAAVTTESSVVSSGADVYALPRLEVKSSDVSGFARLLDEALGAGGGEAGRCAGA